MLLVWLQSKQHYCYSVLIFYNKVAKQATLSILCRNLFSILPPHFQVSPHTVFEGSTPNHYQNVWQISVQFPSAFTDQPLYSFLLSIIKNIESEWAEINQMCSIFKLELGRNPWNERPLWMQGQLQPTLSRHYAVITWLLPRDFSAPDICDQ